jgi:hypothetical protein
VREGDAVKGALAVVRIKGRAVDRGALSLASWVQRIAKQGTARHNVCLTSSCVCDSLCVEVVVDCVWGTPPLVCFSSQD